MPASKTYKESPTTYNECPRPKPTVRTRQRVSVPKHADPNLARDDKALNLRKGLETRENSQNPGDPQADAGSTLAQGEASIYTGEGV